MACYRKECYETEKALKEEIGRLRAVNRVYVHALSRILTQDFGAARPNQCEHGAYYYEPCLDCASVVAQDALAIAGEQK